MRSVPAGSYERTTSLEALWRAYGRYRRGKSRRHRVAAFDLDADQHLLKLRSDLKNGAYAPGAFHLRIIHDPKTRLIVAQPIRDCVVQQALLDDIGEVYERGFIDQAFACGTGRGPVRAVLKFRSWMCKTQYRLSLDIRRYFLSIHRLTLHSLICRRLKDTATQQLVEQLVQVGAEVYQHPLAIETLGLETDPLPQDGGIPIGSYLSQWSGSLYLNGLDHFIKRDLKILGYQRFMDDLTLFADDADRLRAARDSIAQWLATERRLELNPKRWAVVPTDQPAVYLGYRITRAGILPSRKMKRRMKKRLIVNAHQNRARLRRSLLSYRSLMTFG